MTKLGPTGQPVKVLCTSARAHWGTRHAVRRNSLYSNDTTNSTMQAVMRRAEGNTAYCGQCSSSMLQQLEGALPISSSTNNLQH